jgi:hypothetical protein
MGKSNLYTSGTVGKEIPEESDITPGRKSLGPGGVNYNNKEFLGRDTAKIAEAVAGPHEHHKAKHHRRGQK